MINTPKTKAEAKTIRYGKWGGNPEGDSYDPTRCAAEIPDGWPYRQCARKNDYGPDKLYCKQHAKIAVIKWNRDRLTTEGKTNDGNQSS